MTESNGRFPAEKLADMHVEEIVETLVSHVATVQASDVFLHTNESSVEIALRRFGEVQRLAVVSLSQGRQLINYIKAVAGMDIAEHRRPMDSRWYYQAGDKRLDFRVNTVGTLFGEDVSMRVWDREVGLRDLSQLGMIAEGRGKLNSMLANSSGLLLVTGPTGMGKTTTLYACLQRLNDGTRKISTIEDPIEFSLPGMRQVPIVPRLGLDFSVLLRAVLRQSPNVIMIGEIRDKETAATAIRAANSGHLVLASLHAPIASGAIDSMLALGANPHFLSSSLLGVVSQRLVLKLCEKCRVEYDISSSPMTFDLVRDLLSDGQGNAIYGPGGCDDCFGQGYSGRTGIFEIMTMNQTIRRLVAEKRPREEIERAALAGGMLDFRRAALLRVAQGVTSIEEVIRDVPAEFLGLED